jgi:hypothetical protein
MRAEYATRRHGAVLMRAQRCCARTRERAPARRYGERDVYAHGARGETAASAADAQMLMTRAACEADKSAAASAAPCALMLSIFHRAAAVIFERRRAAHAVLILPRCCCR